MKLGEDPGQSPANQERPSRDTGTFQPSGSRRGELMRCCNVKNDDKRNDKIQFSKRVKDETVDDRMVFKKSRSPPLFGPAS